MADAGRKLIAALKEAIEGDFARVTIDGVTWIRRDAPEPPPEAFSQARLEAAKPSIDRELIAKLKANQRAAKMAEQHEEATCMGCMNPISRCSCEFDAEDYCCPECGHPLAASPEPPSEAFAKARLEAWNEAVEACAQLIENGWHIQHPMKPAGVSVGAVPGDKQRAAACRALKRVSP